MLVDELVPYIDNTLRTIPDKKHRAMAGLSMGGMETKHITLARPEVFDYYGLLSGGIYMPDELSIRPSLIFTSCGSHENPNRVIESVEELKKAGHNAVAYISDSTGHEFLTWRRSLKEMSPLLFK